MHSEKTLHVLSGWPVLVLDILMYLGTIPAVLYAVSEPLWGSLIGSGLLLAAAARRERCRFRSTGRSAL